MSRLIIAFIISLILQSNLYCLERINFKSDSNIIIAKLSENRIVFSDSKEKKTYSANLINMQISEIMKGMAWDIRTFKDEIILLIGDGKNKIKAVSVSCDKNGKTEKSVFRHDLKDRLIPYPRIIDNKSFIYQVGDTFYIKDLFSDQIQYRQEDRGFFNLSSFSSQNEKIVALAQSKTNMYGFALVQINKQSLELKKIQFDTVHNFIFKLPGFSVNISNDKIYFGRCENNLIKIFVMKINNNKIDIRQYKTFKNADEILDIMENKILLKNKSSLLVLDL